MITFRFLKNSTAETSKLGELQRLIGQLTTRPGVEIKAVNVWHILENGLIAVAEEEDEQIVGMACLIFIPRLTCNVAEIHDVVVDKQYEGKGIGKALVKMLINEAQRRKVSNIELTTRPDRERANHLYQKLGFKRRETNVYRLELTN